MDVEKRKVELFVILAELEADIEVLRKNVAKAREDLEKVQTADEAKEFDENHDLEEGLNHIQLF